MPDVSHPLTLKIPFFSFSWPIILWKARYNWELGFKAEFLDLWCDEIVKGIWKETITY